MCDDEIKSKVWYFHEKKHKSIKAMSKFIMMDFLQWKLSWFCFLSSMSSSVERAFIVKEITKFNSLSDNADVPLKSIIYDDSLIL